MIDHVKLIHLIDYGLEKNPYYAGTSVKPGLSSFFLRSISKSGSMITETNVPLFYGPYASERGTSSILPILLLYNQNPDFVAAFGDKQKYFPLTVVTSGRYVVFTWLYSIWKEMILRLKYQMFSKENDRNR
ncbi:hypothetical protein Tco_0881341 [Tanacetum coccineum]